MRAKAFLAAAVFTGGLIATSGTTWAGEVAGPPRPTGVVYTGEPNVTGARANSNSICSYSGLNDMINGPLTDIVQTPAEEAPGVPGHGTCAGGSNHNRDK
jgi:hypothetical protein